MSDLGVAGLVLVAAALHATWNAIVKQSDERVWTLAVVVGVGALISVPVALAAEPPGREAWPYLAGSAVIHLCYYAGLLFGYRHGDLGQVYPIARGSGPLLVALVSVTLLGEKLEPLRAAGVLVISLGVLSLAFGGDARSGAPRAVAFALATGVAIAAYTLCDGMGVRAASGKFGYIAWLHIVDGAPFVAAVLVLRRRTAKTFFRQYGARAALGGVIAIVAYSIAVWAMSVTQLAYVASLRETSVIIAAIIGAAYLGEPFGKRRIAAAALVAAGTVLLNVG